MNINVNQNRGHSNHLPVGSFNFFPTFGEHHFFPKRAKTMGVFVDTQKEEVLLPLEEQLLMRDWNHTNPTESSPFVGSAITPNRHRPIQIFYSKGATQRTVANGTNWEIEDYFIGNPVDVGVEKEEIQIGKRIEFNDF